MPSSTIFDRDSFGQPSFVSMFTGLGVKPKRYDPFVDADDMRELHGHFADLRDLIAQTVGNMPAHGAYLDKIAKTGRLP